ncbi:tandem-95 repeat protein [Reinekea marina]|uniref:Tandem-95 repeat protein n=1 Tax=Reinekea marina TaxID=1310421 RepID=A0ABV7WM72_9GAMM|nr:tandem-95 repeat protein [Reinekea marina]MDN3648401.1 tandem-95 repeat protein [Reinekea marina]
MSKVIFSIFMSVMFSALAHAQTYSVVGQASTFDISYSSDYSQSQIDVMNEAAAYWAEQVHSDVPIQVTVDIVQRYYCSFADNAFVLTSEPASAVNFVNAPQADVSYPIALANAYAGYDLLPNQPDIEIRYNSRNVRGVGRCRDFYLKKDANFEQFGQLSLYWETIQEIAHGLGLFPLTDFKTGARANNKPDIYTSFVRSVKHGKMAHELSATELYDAATSSRSITFNGTNAVAYAQENFGSGIIENGVSLYSTPYYNRGTVAAHFSSEVDSQTTLSLPYISGYLPDEGIALAMLKDIGWTVGSNQAPEILNQQTISFAEDTAYTLSLSDLIVSDEQPETLSLEIESGNNYQVSGQTITPNLNFVGNLNINVRVNDGEFKSEWFAVTATVLNVNDAPVITGQSVVSTIEEQSITLSIDMLSITDVDNSVFTLNVLNGTNYSANGNTITPAENFSGALSVPVQAFDGTDLSNVFNVTVDVQATNDAPVIESQNILQWSEDSQPVISTSWVNFTDVDSTQFSLRVLPGNHYDVTTNTLSLEENFSGELTIGVQVFDGLDYSAVFYAAATVLPVNDAPQLAAITPQQTVEDISFFITEALLNIIDPDSDAFTLTIGLGEHYQVAGQEVIPNANWSGELSIPVTVSDGELSSQTQVLNLSVVPVNDLPELTTGELNQVAVYRNHTQQLSATDVDSSTLTFSLDNPPTWASVTPEGLLSVYADAQAVGEWPLTIKVSDGQSTISEQRTLHIINDPTATDLTLEAVVERTIWGLNAWVPVEIIVQNKGPMSEVSAPLVISFDGEWQSQDTRCTVIDNQCNLTVTDASRIKLLIKQTTATSLNFHASWQHSGFEINAENNQATIALTFTDAPITSPQFTVPSFGQGTVRAIALANIQGGRWPEVMFANGPTEASTAYRFEKSLFRPVLHTHLADASNSYAMAITDINNDGHKDWVLANGQGEPNTVYLNQGDGQFELHGLLGNKDSRAVTYADMDRDGDVDLLFANNEDNNTLYFNDGAGNFTLAAEFPARRSRGVIVYDFNGDGKLDILFANRGYRNRIFFNRGRGAVVLGRSFERSTESNGLDFNEVSFGNPEDLTSHVSLADLDGDGIASDVVLVNEGSAEIGANIQIHAVNANETTSLQQEQPTSQINDMSIGDYDGDGIDEIAVLHAGGALEVMSNQLNTVEVMDTQGADSILLVDVDGSGTADVISANSRQGDSRLDFTGDVTNSEDSVASSTTKPLLTTNSTNRPSLTSSNSKAGAFGVYWLLLGIVLLVIRRTR